MHSISNICDMVVIKREQWRYEMYEVLAETPIVCILEWNFMHLMDVSCGGRLVYMFVVFNHIFLT